MIGCGKVASPICQIQPAETRMTGRRPLPEIARGTHDGDAQGVKPFPELSNSTRFKAIASFQAESVLLFM
jgi:hypothetical protein